MNNTVKNLGEEANALLHAAAQTADGAIRSTQRVAQEGAEAVADTLSAARAQTGSALRSLAHDTDVLAHHGMDAVREGVGHLRDRSLSARDATATYIQHEPIKSVLVAAAVGATLMGLLALFTRGGGSGR